MRMFVKYDASGNILSFCKANIFPEIFETPFGKLNEREFAFEVEQTPELNKLECDEIHEKYIVDVKKKKLKKR